MCCSVIFYFFFFFQAEDGIRDTSVTGVQTCALPILGRPSRLAPAANRSPQRDSTYGPSGITAMVALRSEERRVGKEGRAGWAREQCKKRVENCVSRGVGDQRTVCEVGVRMC